MPTFRLGSLNEVCRSPFLLHSPQVFASWPCWPHQLSLLTVPPCAASLGCENRGAVPPGSRHMALTTPGCSGPPVMALTSQAGGFWVGVCGLFAPSGVRSHRACSGLWTAEACDAEVRWPGCRFGEQGKVASASRPHAVTLVLAVRGHPRAGPGTLSPEDGETSGIPGATGGGQLIAATCVLLFLSCR